MQLTPKEFKTGENSSITSLTYDIKLQKTVYVQSKDGTNSVVLEKGSFNLPAGQKIIVTVPVGSSFRPNFVDHKTASGTVPIPVTYNATSNTASFTTDSFSDFNLVSDTYSATVTFHYFDGTADQTVTLNHESFTKKVNDQTYAYKLPTIEGGGWTTTNASDATPVYTAGIVTSGSFESYITLTSGGAQDLYAARKYTIKMGNADGGSGKIKIGDTDNLTGTQQAYAGRAITLTATPTNDTYVFDKMFTKHLHKSVQNMSAARRMDKGGMQYAAVQHRFRRFEQWLTQFTREWTRIRFCSSAT